jgi:hypothetical protein
MTPTTRFRYIERNSYEKDGDFFIPTNRVRILQQWWGIEEDLSIGEWRDIPLEIEQ